MVRPSGDTFGSGEVRVELRVLGLRHRHLVAVDVEGAHASVGDAGCGTAGAGDDVEVSHERTVRRRATRGVGAFPNFTGASFCDNTGEFLAAQLRRGNARCNTAADHISVLDAALAQLPDAHRHGTPILVRADTAGCTREFLAHLRSRRDYGVSCEFSVGWAIRDKERTAISAIPKTVWADAIDADGGHRDGAGLAEISGVLPAAALAGYPVGTRVIVRRERPHPGAQLDAFAERDGWRYTAFATNTAFGQLTRLDARHRAHARVEDRIRCAKDTGLDHFPSRSFAINTAWLAWSCSPST